MIKGLERRILSGRLVLFLEGLLPALIPPLLVLAAGIAAALLGLFEIAPGWLHVLLLLILVGAALYVARGLPAKLSWPRRNAALARIENNSGLSHRPLLALEDKIGVGDAVLWDAHRARLMAGIGRLRLASPHLRLAERDPIALRVFVLLSLLVGGVIAGNDGWNRIGRALSPSLLRAGPPPAIEAWITPPAATGRPPIFLTHGDNRDAPAVPVGSEVTVHVKGARNVALEFGTGTDRKSGTAEDTLALQGRLEKDGTIEVKADGRGLARWPVHVIADTAPQIAWAEAPAPNARSALRLLYTGIDQYGIASVTLEITKPGTAENASPESLSVELPPPPRQSAVPQLAFRDLTANPWAGLDVILQLEAVNAQGLKGRSKAVPITLPERVFTNPVAKQIIAERKTLAREPALALRVARALSALAERPETYNNDMIAYLALRASVHRLVIARGQVPPGIFELLWNAALRIEDGELSNAADALRQAQENLQKALAENRPEAEIDQLMQALRQAMDNYLKNMVQNALRKGPSHLPPGTRTIGQNELQRLLDQAQRLSAAGSRDAARELLSMLQNMLENLNGAQGGQSDSAQDKADSEALSKLGQLMNRQQQLMDKTMRESQRGPKSPGTAEAPQTDLDPGLAREQQALRKELGEVMEGLGGADEEIPNAFGAADQAMRHADGALQGKRPGSAMQSQADAMTRLREGAKALSEKMTERQNGAPGVRQGRGNAGNDPLGRPAGPGAQPDQGLSVTVPDESEIERARRIMDELRKRAGERQRPKPELDYLDRLLERF